MWWWNGPPPMWGMWWIFPLIGIAFFVVILFIFLHFVTGRGSFCGPRRYGEVEDLRREIRELRDEVARLKK